MALPATAIINIRSTATAGNVNGGGFNSARGGTDYSLQDAAQINGGVDGTSTASTTFTSALQTFTSAMVGNYLHITAGTGATAGWYEIVTYVDGHTVTLDRTSGTYTAATFYVGGALSLGSSTSGRTDQDAFNIAIAGNVFNVKGATYTLGVAVTITANGTASVPVKIIGYTTNPNDTCNGTSRPVFACGANAFNYGTYWSTANVIFTSTNGICVQGSTSTAFSNCKMVNSGTSSTGAAFSPNSSAASALINCELVCYRGRGVNANSSNIVITNCYIHDCDIGLRCSSAGSGTVIVENLIENCVTGAIIFTAAYASPVFIYGNTLHGASNKLGLGIQFATGCTDMRVRNNIISGFTTGVTHADTQSAGVDDYNDYYNNTNDVSAVGQWQKGPNDTAVNPSYTSVGQVTGATATTTSGNHLVQSGATFVASGVVAGRDYVYIVSGTGVTAGIYGILSVDSETQITADITLTANATADKVFQITTGRNFAIGSAMKALGFPGAMQGGYTTGYRSQGAIQRQEPAGGGGGSYCFVG